MTFVIGLRAAPDRHPPMWFSSCLLACARASGCSAQPRAGRRRWFQIFCAFRHSVANAPLPGGASIGESAFKYVCSTSCPSAPLYRSLELAELRCSGGSRNGEAVLQHLEARDLAVRDG